MSFSFAIFSALCPIDSPVLGSEMAGATGTRSFGRTFENALSFWLMLFALFAAISTSVNPRECRIGTFESDSAPPAITQSMWPSAIWSAASAMA